MTKKEELSETEISERTGLGEPDETDKSEEGNKPEDNKEETQTSEESEEGDELTDESDDLSEDEDEEPEDKSKSEEDEDDDEDKEPSSKEKRTVPYNKLKTERKKRKDAENKLGEFLENFDDKIGTAVEKALTSIKEKDQPGEAEKAAAELSEEVGLDEKGLAKILKTAVDLASKGQVSPELLKRLESLGKLEESQKKIEEKQKEDEDVSKFNKEWDLFVPWLKKRFPNAGDDELGEAKTAMDNLSHSKKYHLIPELDYIFFKNRKKFQTILKLLKGKSGEKSKTVKGEEIGEDETDKLTDIENLTPEIIKKRDAEDAARNKSAEKDYTIIEPV